MRDAVRGELMHAFGSEPNGWQPVSGGCISELARVRFADGSVRCVKLAPAPVLEAEVAGLAALRATRTVRVPDVEALGDGWLALEWLEPGRGSDAEWAELGGALATLHRTTAGADCGFAQDNYIGTLPQDNAARATWWEFWREARLRPQLARAAGQLEASEFEQLFERLPELLRAADRDGMSLLHGDLWSGNVHMMVSEAALIDPSCYRGHREGDLAMAALFGGFPAAFWSGYSEAWPLAAGAEQRRAVYQLYYLLVHVNLFGASYVPQVRAVLRRALG